MSLNMFSTTLSPMLVMFLCILIGFILKKRSLLPEDAGTVMSKLENYVFVPALIISNFMNYCTLESLSENYSVIIYSAVALFIAMAIAIPLSYVFVKKGDDTYLRNIYKYALTFGNFSFMGNAIVPAILGEVYGDDVLYKYLLFALPLNIIAYTWGIFIMIPKGKSKGNPLKNLLNPIFFALIIGAVLGLTGLGAKMPQIVVTVIDYCKSCMAPVAMILTGFVIGGYSIKTMLSNKRVYIATALRLAVLPTLIIGILYFLGASKFILSLTLFAYATPLGVNTVIFPAAYGGNTSTGAAMASISHTLGTVTIPIMYALLNAVV